jgi:putative NADH-flavin reductase
MNIVVYGATGNAGGAIVKELISRGHNTTGVARHVDSLKQTQGVIAKTDDLSTVDAIAEIIKGADAVVSAYNPPSDNANALNGVTRREIEAVKKSGQQRLLVVGGCGLLEVAPGMTLIKSGKMPVEYMPLALAHESALHELKESDINWTYLSCALYFVPGERTGKFRLGASELVADANGDSRISFADYAIAMVDEIEQPTHERRSFSIGY